MNRKSAPNPIFKKHNMKKIMFAKFYRGTQWNILFYLTLIYKKSTLFSSFAERKLILKENVSEYQPKLIKKTMLTLCWILTLFVSGVEVREINLPGKNLLQWYLVFVVLSENLEKEILIFPCFCTMSMLVSDKWPFCKLLKYTSYPKFDSKISSAVKRIKVKESLWGLNETN